ncbi:hypothetical protein B0H14DRAFT_1307336 [Mycena olivaceomarginata]|nr:hypothetical protein B0H14DRAFT_1307336 [Mycena olivaceomarginata]
MTTRVALRYFRVQIFALFPRIVAALVRHARTWFHALALPFLDGHARPLLPTALDIHMADPARCARLWESTTRARSFPGIYSPCSLRARDEGYSFISAGGSADYLLWEEMLLPPPSPIDLPTRGPPSLSQVD